MTVRTIPFHILDVFAESRHQGNQLCVFPDAAGLTDAQMQAMAQEINFAESTFIQGGSPSDGFRVRIFTPEYEVPFAGHPTLGTAWLIANYLLPTRPPVVWIHLGVGPVRVDVGTERLWLETAQPRFGQTFPPDDLSDVLGLPATAFVAEQPAALISTGMPYLIVPLSSRAALQSVRLESNAVARWLLERGLFKTNSLDGQTTAFYLFCREPYDPANALNARALFVENGRIVEDAATGSAASCLLAYRLKQENVSELSFRLEQGYALNRPALIHLHGGRLPDQTYSLRVGGRVRPVAQGEWRID